MMRRLALLLVVAGLAWAAAPAPASALNPLGAVCNAAGAVSKVAAIPCTVVKHAGTVVGVGKRLVGGGSPVGAAASLGAAFTIGALVASVLGAAQYTLDETAKVLGATTRPNLTSTWFSGTYWRMAGIAAVLTLPFLFAAAVQALLRSDLALLARATLMHLPLALLAVSIAAPLTMLLLAASDELSAIVSGATGHESAHFLSASSLAIGGLSGFVSPFLAFLVGAFTVAGAVVLWIELLMRETAVYVIVLMLPLTFAAFVWPARRIWAVRTVEVLCALILSKFAIVAVLSLGGAALATSLGTASVVGWLAGLVLVVMATLMPWALLRLVPLTELASAAAGSLRGELRGTLGAGRAADVAARSGYDWASKATSYMRRQAQDILPHHGPEDAVAGDAVAGDAVAGGDDASAPRPGPSPAPQSDDEPSHEARDGEAPASDAPAQTAKPTESGAEATPIAPTPRASEPGSAPATRSPESELMDAEHMTREIRYGKVVAAREKPPQPVVTERRGGSELTETATADDPNPLPSSQERPEGSL